MKMPSVSKCEVAGCKYNASLWCQRSEIRVGYKDGKAQCLSFQALSSKAGEIHSGRNHSYQMCLSPEIFIG